VPESGPASDPAGGEGNQGAGQWVGALSRDDDSHFQQSSGEELKTKVEEAGRMKRVVAAHVHGKEGIMAALRDAGARDVHG
jgi:imidazolonepropionase-like amidohydrolase